MDHYIAYHNAEIRGTCADITYPHVRTKKKVINKEGCTVWLIAGEDPDIGKTTKSFFIAAKFIADKCWTNKYMGDALPNEISGEGVLYKLTKPISGTELIEQIKIESNTFRNGFHELKDITIINELIKLT